MMQATYLLWIRDSKCLVLLLTETRTDQEYYCGYHDLETVTITGRLRNTSMTTEHEQI